VTKDKRATTPTNRSRYESPNRAPTISVPTPAVVGVAAGAVGLAVGCKAGSGIVELLVSVEEGSGDAVMVAAASGDGVAVPLGFGVDVLVRVDVAVGVPVSVAVGEGVSVGRRVSVGVAVGEGVNVGDGVGVGGGTTRRQASSQKELLCLTRYSGCPLV